MKKITELRNRIIDGMSMIFGVYNAYIEPIENSDCRLKTEFVTWRKYVNRVKISVINYHTGTETAPSHRQRKMANRNFSQYRYYNRALA